jgi:acyl-CoA thioesterase FadM
MESLRRPVAPADCDILGHMNVASYIAAVSDAMFTVETAIGLGRAEMETRRRALVAAHLEADYRTEMLAGDVIVMQSRVVHVGTKSARFAHRMCRMDDNVLAFECENVSVMFDLDRRCAVAFPEDVRARLMTIMQETK